MLPVDNFPGLETATYLLLPLPSPPSSSCNPSNPCSTSPRYPKSREEQREAESGEGVVVVVVLSCALCSVGYWPDYILTCSFASLRPTERRWSGSTFFRISEDRNFQIINIFFLEFCCKSVSFVTTDLSLIRTWSDVLRIHMDQNDRDRSHVWSWTFSNFRFCL